MEKMSRNDYFMNIAKVTAERTTCFSEPKGAVLVKENRIISTGYTGAPNGIDSCKYEDKECRKRKLGYGHGKGHDECKAVHAESNAILSAALLGISTKGSILYCTHKPCSECTKMLIQAGIHKIYYLNDYSSKFADEMLKQTNIEVIKYEEGC